MCSSAPSGRDRLSSSHVQGVLAILCLSLSSLYAMTCAAYLLRAASLAFARTSNRAVCLRRQYAMTSVAYSPWAASLTFASAPIARLAVHVDGRFLLARHAAIVRSSYAHSPLCASPPPSPRVRQLASAPLLVHVATCARTPPTRYVDLSAVLHVAPALGSKRHITRAAHAASHTRCLRDASILIAFHA